MICEKCEALNALIDGYRRERDEAQWHAEGLRAALALVEAERDEARAEVERLQEDRDKWRDRYHAMRTDVGLSGDVEDEITCAYRRGAEAMRVNVMQYLVRQQNEATVMVVDTAIKGVHKLPIPEEP